MLNDMKATKIKLTYKDPKTSSDVEVFCSSDEEIAEAFKRMYEVGGHHIEFEVEENVKER
jgi:hypothetical protein